MVLDVLIVGAGLAGLCCARRVQQAGLRFLVLEASDGVGGRIRTDRIDGFQLDRCFQVFLTAYPEALLDRPLASAPSGTPLVVLAHRFILG